MGVTRMNITLPDDVVRILKKKTKAGEKSAYIAEAIRQHEKHQSARKLFRELIEAYSSRGEDQGELKDWDSTLQDGLDED